LNIVSLCRGGFFPNKEKEKRKLAIEDNLKAIEEAAQLETPLIVLVCGADPTQSLEDSRKQIKKVLKQFFRRQKPAGIKLAIEPLHPMYADTRSAINTLAQANDMAEANKFPICWRGSRCISSLVGSIFGTGNKTLRRK
jgi:sugar phosphate isomerase/epimerase